MFLGFMLTKRGIEENLEKCNVVIDMRSPRSVKEVRIITLARFLSRSVEKSTPIFQQLRKAEHFRWIDKCEAIFQNLIIILEEEGEQRPIYYVSKVLQGVELRYQKIEKVALAIVIATRKLSPYFQSHP
ncbi:hypothetical protein CR513_56916, partial [Mucuna pruriens]